MVQKIWPMCPMNSDAKTFSHVAYIRLKEFALLPHLVVKKIPEEK